MGRAPWQEGRLPGPCGSVSRARALRFAQQAAGQTPCGPDSQSGRFGCTRARHQGSGASDGERAPAVQAPADKAGCAMPSRGKALSGTTGAPRKARPLGREALGGRPRGERPRGGRPRGERPRGERPRGERPRGERPLGREALGGRLLGGRPLGERPLGSAPWGEAPWREAPWGEAPGREAPWGEAPGREAPWGERPLPGGKRTRARGGEGSPPRARVGWVRQGGAGAARQERSVTPYLFLRVSSAWSSSSAARASVSVASRSRSTRA